MEARLELNFFGFKPASFSHVNVQDLKFVSTRTVRFTKQKQEGLCQNKVNSSFTSTFTDHQVRLLRTQLQNGLLF